MSETPITPDAPEFKPVTAEELKKWLWNDRERQADVAKRLYVSDRTIDNWRTKKNPIPDQYHEPLRKMMSGDDELLLRLAPGLRERIAKAAKTKDYPSVESLVGDILNKFFAVALLGVVGYQLSHPSDHAARLVGRRREGGTVLAVEA